MSMSQIIVSKSNRARLKNEFQCSDSSLSIALHFKWNSILARRIRSRAVNHYQAIPVIF